MAVRTGNSQGWLVLGRKTAALLASAAVNLINPALQAGLPVVVVFVPVVVAPLMRIGIPPSLVFVPAALAYFGEFGAILSRFLAVSAVFGHGLMQVVIGSVGIMLTISGCAGRSEGYETCRQQEPGGDFPERKSGNLHGSNSSWI